jgi:hypothetical protein
VEREGKIGLPEVPDLQHGANEELGTDQQYRAVQTHEQVREDQVQDTVPELPQDPDGQA